MTILALYLCLTMGMTPVETTLEPIIPANVVQEFVPQEEVHILSKADGTLLATVQTDGDRMSIRYSRDVTVFEVEHWDGELDYSFDQLVLPLTEETIAMSPVGSNTIEVVRVSSAETETRLTIELD